MTVDGSRMARRADAEQNTRKILEAAATCLGRSPNASVADIASTAGLGRVTVYGHFASREALIDAALVRLLDQGDAVLSQLDLNGEPREALAALIQSSWQLIADAANVLEAAQAVLPPERIRDLHGKPAHRVENLIRRGQSEGVFRTDLPLGWLVNLLHYVLKGAAADVRSGRLDASDAPHLITTTVLATFATPD